MLHLKPSEIFYSQASISAHFGRSTDHPYKKIGETLDDLCEGRISVSSIPRITVTKKGKDGKWYTLDNRRLWIFRHLEGAGKCSTIPCEEQSMGDILYSHKFSSTNGGVSVTFFYGSDPGGEWHKRITPADPKPETTEPENKEDVEDSLEKLTLED